MTDLLWLKELRPEIPAAQRPAIVREAFDWLASDPRGQIVLCTILDDLGFLSQIKATDAIQMAGAVEARNIALGIIGHFGSDSWRQVMYALTRKE